MSKVSVRRSISSPRIQRTAITSVSRFVSLPALWLGRLRCRHELSMLTPEQMRDTGLHPEIVRRESRKPFWKA